MTLQELVDANCAETVPISISAAKQKIQSASDFLRAAKTLLDIPSPLFDPAYTNIYDSIRKSLEALLSLNGYKLRKSNLESIKHGYHTATIEIAEELIGSELINNEFARIKRIKKKRKDIEYTTFTISPSEINQALEDADALLKKIDEKIKTDDPQQGLI
jgi:uncharacterized protein (UPF0332 family)